MKRLEDQLQIQTCAYLAHALIPPALFFHIPNGGHRSKAQAGMFKAMGVKAGLPDLCIILAGRAYWIELKAPKGVLSATQKDMREKLAMAGCSHWAQARSLDEVIEILKDWNILTRGRLAA